MRSFSKETYIFSLADDYYKEHGTYACDDNIEDYTVTVHLNLMLLLKISTVHALPSYVMLMLISEIILYFLGICR